MNSLELIESFSEFKDDKLINRETLMAILEEVFRNTLKKKYGSDILPLYPVQIKCRDEIHLSSLWINP